MKMKLSYRLFLIIILCFLIPYVLLYFGSYWRAENIIREKTEDVEEENIQQVGSIIENQCLNIINASNYLVSLDHYGHLLHQERGTYDFLSEYQTVNGLIQNVNNSLLNARADISIFSESTLLYSTAVFQSVEFQEFYHLYIEENDHLDNYSPFFSKVHESYINIKTENYISCIRRISKFDEENFYLVISFPVSAFEPGLNSAMGTMILLDSAGSIICQSPDTPEDYSGIAAAALESRGESEEAFKHLEISGTNNMATAYDLPLYGWTLLNVTSRSFLYAEIYQLRTIILALSLVLIGICLAVTFYCIYHQLKPLLLLKKNMESVIRGNLKAEVTVVDSQDEIGVLTRTFHNMLGEINVLIDKVKKKEREENELRFEMLLAQINPHFLFNTLNSIKWMSVVARTDNITATITSLGRLLEISMNKVNDILPVREELTNIKSYIQIQQIRYPGQFEVQYDIDDSILSCPTPKLILQPLVENSILHNVEHRDFLTIRITGKKKDGLLEFTVWDNGCGIAPEKLPTIIRPGSGAKSGKVFNGIGVYNVHERIRVIYGNSYGLRYESDGHSYTKAILAFPDVTEADEKGGLDNP